MEYFLFSANNSFSVCHVKENTFTSFFLTKLFKKMIRNILAQSHVQVLISPPNLGGNSVASHMEISQIIQSLNNKGGALSYIVSGIYIRYFKRFKYVRKTLVHDNNIFTVESGNRKFSHLYTNTLVI